MRTDSPEEEPPSPARRSRNRGRARGARLRPAAAARRSSSALSVIALYGVLKRPPPHTQQKKLGALTPPVGFEDQATNSPAARPDGYTNAKRCPRDVNYVVCEVFFARASQYGAGFNLATTRVGL